MPRDASLLASSRALKAAPPFWGSRRIWASLRFIEPWPRTKKRIWRRMREHHLVVPPHLKLTAKRPPTGSKARPAKPTAGWGLDMTKGMVEGCGWIDIVVVRAWYTQAMVGS
jgi:hypothetical protein